MSTAVIDDRVARLVSIEHQCHSDSSKFSSVLAATIFSRKYFHINEIKPALQVSNNKLSIIIVKWMNPGIVGIAAMPWEHNSDAIFGMSI